MLTKKIIIDLRNSTPIYKQVEDLRINNSIAQKILEQSINTVLTTSTYSSFSEAIDDLFKNNIIDKDILDEIIFKRWIALDNTYYFLEQLICEHKLSSIEVIKQFVDQITINQIKNILFKHNFSIITPKHLEQELGIKFNINIETFFIRYINRAQFFDNEVKIYLDTQSKFIEYLLNDLKNNINTYINKIYMMHKDSYI